MSVYCNFTLLIGYCFQLEQPHVVSILSSRMWLSSTSLLYELPGRM